MLNWFKPSPPEEGGIYEHRWSDKDYQVIEPPSFEGDCIKLQELFFDDDANFTGYGDVFYMDMDVFNKSYIWIGDTL